MNKVAKRRRMKRKLKQKFTAPISTIQIWIIISIDDVMILSVKHKLFFAIEIFIFIGKKGQKVARTSFSRSSKLIQDRGYPVYKFERADPYGLNWCPRLRRYPKWEALRANVRRNNHAKKHENTKTRKYENTKTRKYENTKIRKYENTKMDKMEN